MSGLRRLVAFISPRLAGPVECEACGGEFSCGAGLRGCWCQEIDLNQQTLQELKGRYRKCICRKCLTAYADGTAQTLKSDS